MYGSGYSISRYSESLNGEEFFYSAHYYPSQQLIIRSALPYNVSLSEHLRADSGFVWFTIIISLILMTLFYRFTHKLGTSITQLQQFALKADRNEPIDLDILETFPKMNWEKSHSISLRYTNVFTGQKKPYTLNVRN